MLWMLVAILVTSSLTAGLIAASNIQSGVILPEDYSSQQVVAITDGLGKRYLEEEQIGFTELPSVLEGLRAMEDKQFDMLMHSAAALNYLIRTRSDLDLPVRSADLRRQDFAMAFPTDSPLREAVNRRILHIIRSGQWRTWRERYTSRKAS
jgi:ABC-type amino acid transport substrate-binding protein